MGRPCDPKNLLAITRAAGQVDGDFFPEVERLKNFDGEQLAHYENFMSKEFGINLKKEGSSVLDIIGKRSKTEKIKSLVDDRLYTHPSKMFTKKFYGAIDKRFTEWLSSENPNWETYQEKIGAPARRLLTDLDEILRASQSKFERNAKLRAFGIKPDTLYETLKYLDWLGKGAHLQKGDLITELLKDSGGKVAKAQAYLNLVWTAGNAIDMLRPYSHYTAKSPDGFLKVLKGTLSALKSGNLVKRLPELERAGIYHSDHLGQGGSNKDPFEWSVTAQKNLTWHLSKEFGEDGYTGIRDLLFDSKPWDQPLAFQSPSANLYFGLFRYPLNETRWIFRTTKSALSGNPRDIANLTLYSLVKAALVGGTSLFPDLLYNALSDEHKDVIAEIESQLQLNIVRRASGAVLNAAGIDAEIDLSDYTRPLSGKLGARLGTIKSTADAVITYGIKSGISAAEGKMDAATIHALAAANAFNNLTGFFNSLQFVDKTAQMTNSTTITRAYEAMAESLQKEFDIHKTSKHILKAIAGSGNVKTPDKAVGGSLEGLGLKKLDNLKSLK